MDREFVARAIYSCGKEEGTVSAREKRGERLWAEGCGGLGQSGPSARGGLGRSAGLAGQVGSLGWVRLGALSPS